MEGRGTWLQRAKEKAAATLAEKTGAAMPADGSSHGGAAPPDGSSVGHGGEKTEANEKEEPSASGAEENAAIVAAAGPAFPTLGVTLDFLERFTAEHVRGKPSRYCTAKVDCQASLPDELSYKKGEILGIGDLSAVNDGWLVGYRRAGDWGERKKFRLEAVDRLAGLSTDEVCGDIIKPACTAASWPEDEKERSYARMVRAEGETGVGEANVFASHAWTFVFEELVESLRFFETQQIAAGEEPSLFWLDIFVVDENAAHTYPSEWWQTSFTQAVGTIGHTALVLTPWSAPVPLRRAWCLWEIYSTLGENAKLSVCMSDAESADFHRALVENVDGVITALCTIDAETAEAGSKKDLDMIFAAVRTLDGGFQTLNTTVMDQMRSWLIDSMIRALAAYGLRFKALPTKHLLCCAASGDKSDWRSTIKPLFAVGCDCDDDLDDGGADLRITFGNWYRTGAGTKQDASICGEHYGELSRMQKLKWTAIKSIADLGKDAELFAETKYELVGEVHGGEEAEANAASLLIAATRLVCEMGAIDHIAWGETAASRKAVALRTKLYGERDVRTLEAMMELSKSIEVDDDEEYELLIRCLEVRKELLPANDPQIADTLKYLGRFMAENMEDTKTALSFFQKALAIFEHHDPEGRNTDTLSTVNELACALEEEGRVDDARRYSERAYKLNLKWLGPSHLETSTCANNLALLILNEFSKEALSAVPLLRLNLKTCEVVMGVDAVDTAEGRKHLAHCLLECVKLTMTKAAKSLFREGDRVKLMDDQATNRQLAKKHGGWAEDMDELCGQVGAVSRIDADGDVFVIFDAGARTATVKHGGRGKRQDYCLNPKALTLLERPDTPPGLDDATPKLSAVMPEGWSGTEEQAEREVEEEAEALLVRALSVLEAEVGGSEATGSSARLSADLLCDLYEKQGRKKEMKAMRKRKDALEAWCSSSEEDSSASESDSDEDSEEVQDLLMAMSPGLARALQHDNDEPVTVADLESALDSLHIVNAQRPPQSETAIQDREDTEKALAKKLKIARRRDRAHSLLTPAKDGEGTELEHTVGGGLLSRLQSTAQPASVPEGTPPPSQRPSTEPSAGGSGLQLEPKTPPAGALGEDLVALSIAVQSASPPTHAFGRAATTGSRELDGATEDRQFVDLLASLGLQGHAVALEAQAIVTCDELRDLTESEMDSLGMTAAERASLAAWVAGL